MAGRPKISDRVGRIPKSTIHEMTRRSKDVDDVAFLSWAKPTSDTPDHIKDDAIAAIREGLVERYSENAGLPEGGRKSSTNSSGTTTSMPKCPKSCLQSEPLRDWRLP